MKYLVLLFFIGATLLSASSSEHGGETDIVPRLVNFFIFAGLIYYLLAKHIKNFFESRQIGIAQELEKVEEKIKSSAKIKEAALLKIEEARKIAREIEENTAKEIELIVKKIEKDLAFDLEQIEKHKEELKIVSQNKMIREVVTESLEEMLDVDNITKDNDELIKSIIKKVA